jgi:serine/threonine protein kinase
MKPPLGDVVDGYRIVERIWQGSTSTVYLARAIQSPPPFTLYVAVKTLSSHKSSQHYIKQFSREWKLTSSLDHPNIVKVFSLVKNGATQHLFMEYVKGKSLRHWFSERLFLFEEVVEIFLGLLSGLICLQEKKIIHKDIKPENILVSEDISQIKLIDFGYAVKDSLFRKDLFPFAGTEKYMAPERKSGKADGRSDLYSVGKVIEEMLEKLPYTPQFIKPIVGKCVNLLPEERYQAADETKKDLLFFYDYFKRKHEMRRSR